MDSSLLKVFVAVANKKSISLGAQDLGFTQSNVTHRIKQLEKVIGYDLFFRIPSGVILTKEGEKLYPFAIDIVKRVEEATLQMKNLNHQELLRIGTSQANAAIRLLRIVEKLNKKYPKMQITITTNETKKIIEDLLEFKIDIGFVVGRPKSSDIIVLNRVDEDLCLIESKDWQSKNCLIGYREDSIHFNYLKEYMRKIGNDDFNTMTFQNYHLIQEMVSKGYGKAFIFRELIEKYGFANKFNLSKIDLNEEELSTFMICRKNNIPMIEEYLKRIKL